MRKLSLPVSFALIATLVAVTGCGNRGAQGDEFINALPTEEAVKLNVPESDGQALAIGETSEFYEHTYNVSRGVNAHIGAVFVLIGAIVRTEPTTEEENIRVWGPSEPEGLERLSYRFTVEKVDEGVFEYVLHARPKASEAEEDFKAIWSGVAYPDPEAETVGSGELTLHFDNDDDDCSTGEAVVTYDAQPELRQVDIAFNGVDNICDEDEGQLQDYHYAEAADGSGDFLFSIKGNIHAADEDRPLEETFTIKSRWLSSGEGRSDVTLTSSEIEADLAELLPESDSTNVKVTECWNDLFELTYTTSEPAELAEHLRAEDGDASACPFQEADHPEDVEQI